VSFLRRLLLWLGSQLGLADEAEDPREALDLVYARQVELLAKTRRAVVDVVTARKRIELQSRQLAPTIAKLDEQARDALDGGRQDAAREALTWRATLQGELDGLERQAASLSEEEARLRQSASRIELGLQQLQVRRDALRASYAAARARAEASRSLAEAGREDSDLRLALAEAEERVRRTRAMADALDGLAARGALAAGGADALRNQAAAEAEAARIEEELLWGPQAQQKGSPKEGEGPQ